MNKQHNYCIILAGGIGRRLWPVSKQAKPKQFVDIFGVGRTLLQQTFDRFARIMDKTTSSSPPIRNTCRWSKSSCQNSPTVASSLSPCSSQRPPPQLGPPATSPTSTATPTSSSPPPTSSSSTRPTLPSRLPEVSTSCRSTTTSSSWAPCQRFPTRPTAISSRGASASTTPPRASNPSPKTNARICPHVCRER